MRIFVSLLSAMFPPLIFWLGGEEIFVRGPSLALSVFLGVVVGVWIFFCPWWPKKGGK